MSASAPVPEDHPLMKAWEAYVATEDYANSFKWAGMPEHRKGSMWAAFLQGWFAAGGENPHAPKAVLGNAPGWKLVPATLTPEMLQAAVGDDTSEYGYVKAIWASILGAAPEPTSPLGVGNELTFQALADVNITRCRRWHDPNGWSPQMWGLAMCGEAGEVANALKKLHRHDEGIQQAVDSKDRAVLVQNVATEIGDTAVYLDLLAQRLDLRLEDCVRDTFNRISVREGFPERLPQAVPSQSSSQGESK